MPGQRGQSQPWALIQGALRQVARAAVTKCPRLGSSTSRNVSARSFGGHKSKIKVLAGGFILKAVEENLLQAPPWLGDASSPRVFL